MRVWSFDAETACWLLAVTATVFTPSLWPRKVWSAVPPARPPELEGAVVGGRDGQAAIGSDCDGVDPVGVAAEGAQFSGVCQVPQLEGAVL